MFSNNSFHFIRFSFDGGGWYTYCKVQATDRTVKASQETERDSREGWYTKALECPSVQVEGKPCVFLFPLDKNYLVPTLIYKPLSKFVLIQTVMTFSATFSRS